MNSNTNSYTVTQCVPLSEVIERQSWSGGWICPDCEHHEGNLHCSMNMFISFVGCYTKGCQAFKEKTHEIQGI